MKSQLKRPKQEVIDCAAGLRALTMSSSVDEIKRLIEEGYAHLQELKAAAHCNPLVYNSFAARVDRAEYLLEMKRKEIQGERRAG